MASGGSGRRGFKKLPSLVLPIAAARLASGFGLRLTELKRTTAGGEVQTYTLHSMLPTELLRQCCHDVMEDAGETACAAAGLCQAFGSKREREREQTHQALSRAGTSPRPPHTNAVGLPDLPMACLLSVAASRPYSCRAWLHGARAGTDSAQQRPHGRRWGREPAGWLHTHGSSLQATCMQQRAPFRLPAACPLCHALSTQYHPPPPPPSCTLPLTAAAAR